MKTSESIKEIAGALAKAQAEMGRVVKDKTAHVVAKSGAKFDFNYADLASVLDVVKPALSKHGIAIVQAAALEGDKVAVETRLVHASGEWIESALSVKPEEIAPQKIGSAITYARRYALSSMVGVASEEDDDGNAAEGNKATIAARPSEPTKSRAETVKARVQAQRAIPADPEARKKDIRARMEKARIPGNEMAAMLGEWIGRPVDASLVLTADDWTRADTALEQLTSAGETLARAQHANH